MSSAYASLFYVRFALPYESFFDAHPPNPQKEDVPGNASGGFGRGALVYVGARMVAFTICKQT